MSLSSISKSNKDKLPPILKKSSKYKLSDREPDFEYEDNHSSIANKSNEDNKTPVDNTKVILLCKFLIGCFRIFK